MPRWDGDVLSVLGCSVIGFLGLWFGICFLLGLKLESERELKIEYVE
jgi:hypothetical protein